MYINTKNCFLNCIDYNTILEVHKSYKQVQQAQQVQHD